MLPQYEARPRYRCGALGRVCGKEGVVVPTMVVPIINSPVPLYLQMRFPLCLDHASAFTMAEYDRVAGAGWYDLAADAIKSARREAINPFPKDPGFKWVPFVVDPHWEPEPKEKCYVIMQETVTLMAKGWQQKLWDDRYT